jgi:chromosome segregation ATPase
MEMKSKMKAVQDEINQLKKERADKVLDLDKFYEAEWNACEKNKELEEENENLKKENKKLKEAFEDQHKYSCELGDYIDTNVPIKILNENRELKEKNERLDKKVGELQKIRETDIDFDLHNAHVNLLKGEIEELKEGIKELKEENGKMTALATECNELYKALGILHACMSGKSI